MLFWCSAKKIILQPAIFGKMWIYSSNLPTGTISRGTFRGIGGIIHHSLLAAPGWARPRPFSPEPGRRLFSTPGQADPDLDIFCTASSTAIEFF